MFCLGSNEIVAPVFLRNRGIFEKSGPQHAVKSNHAQTSALLFIAFGGIELLTALADAMRILLSHVSVH